MTKPWIVDDAGTLINIATRETYDYVSELVDVLNEKDKEIQRLRLIINGLNYALKNIMQIDVEIDLNEYGDDV